MRVTVDAMAGDEVVSSCALGVGRWSAASPPPIAGRLYDVALTGARPLLAGASLFVAEERVAAIHRRDGRVGLIGTIESRDPDGMGAQRLAPASVTLIELPDGVEPGAWIRVALDAAVLQLFAVGG